MVITGDFNLYYLPITFRSLISLKTVKIQKRSMQQHEIDVHGPS